MYRGPFIFGGVLLLLIIGVVLIFGHHGKKPVTTTNTIQPLASYANTDTVTSMTIDGIVNGDDIHRQIKITISQTSRELDVIQGYSGNIIQKNTFYNTQDAYRVFLKSINNSGFLDQRKNIPANLDYEGVCPLGDRFIFTLQQNGNTLSNLWTSTCGLKTGNLAVGSGTLQTLFQEQITDYQELVANVNLNQ